jgi:DNA modification methylase
MRPLPLSLIRNTVRHGDCVKLMRRMDAESIDFVLTDPPYLVNYRDRQGRTVANDNNSGWLIPAFDEIHRLMKPGSLCVSFYGWNAVGAFAEAWNLAGLRIVGHLVFRKPYSSSARFLKHEHENAFLLAKGNARPPAMPIGDIRDDWRYTGNRLHPTQKPVEVLWPLIEVYAAEQY